MPLFPNIDALQAAVDAEIIANGNEEITGPIMNEMLNGCIEFIRKSPLNWSKASLVSGGGVVSISDEYTGVVVFMTTTPTSLTWGDNFYYQYVFINMTAADIPLFGLLRYYKTDGTVAASIPANSAVTIYKASNDLWIGIVSTGGGGGGSTQKQPKSYVVGVTDGAPTPDTLTWTLPVFLNSYVTLFIGNLLVDMEDSGDGSPYMTKPLASDTLTISNFGNGWSVGDKLSFILITP